MEVVRVVIAGLFRPIRGRRSNLYFSETSTEHFACTHPANLVHWWLTLRLVALRVHQHSGTWKQGLGSGVRRPSSGGAGVGVGQVVVVAALWS